MNNKGTDKTVLVVEDDVLLALLLEKMVSKLGFSVSGKATSGEEAVEKASELQPDIILMDISLEGQMDGITAVQMIRKHYDIPVIYITGNSDSYNYDRAEDTGFVDYLVKPISSEMLQIPLQKASKLSRKQY